MSEILDLFRAKTHRVSSPAGTLARDFLEDLDAVNERFAVSLRGPGEVYPWNTNWRESARAPRWLNDFLRADESDVADWLESGAFLPANEERVLLEMANHFRSAASWSMVVHGNVRDYVFDAHLGYAPFAEVAACYWTDTDLFSVHPNRSDAAVLDVSLSSGIELRRGVEGSPGHPFLDGEILKHRREFERSPLEDRILADLGFLEKLLSDANSPPLLLIFERPSLFVGHEREGGRLSAAVEYFLDWSGRIPASPRHLLLLLVDDPSELHPDLRKRVNGLIQFELLRPYLTVDRRRFLLACRAACGDRPIRLAETRLRSRATTMPYRTAEIGQLAEATAGLNLVGIETCLLSLLEKGVAGQAIGYLKEQRQELLESESEGLLKVVEPEAQADHLVGGLQWLRERLRFVVQGMTADSKAIERQLVPMGILFIGPPGTGKSLMAEALANECQKAGVHFVKMGDFREMWVGQSERNFTRILKVLEAFGRVIVFMDEIDQTEGGSRSSGGRHETSRRVFGKLLEFMADQKHRGRILWIAATNRPGEMDPALLRPGRFDLILPFGPPDSDGAAEILRLHLAKTGLPCRVSESESQELGGQMSARRITGAEIQLVVIEAARRALTGGSKEITGEKLTEILEDYLGQGKTGQEYERMVDECRRFVPFRSVQSRI